MLNYLHVLVSSVLARMKERLNTKESSNKRHGGHILPGEFHHLSEPCLLPLLNQFLVRGSSSDSYLLAAEYVRKRISHFGLIRPASSAVC